MVVFVATWAKTAMSVLPIVEVRAIAALLDFAHIVNQAVVATKAHRIISRIMGVNPITG